MLLCWDEKTDWRLGFEGTGLYRQRLGVGLALDISKGSILFIAESYMLLQVSLRPGCELLLGMSRRH